MVIQQSSALKFFRVMSVLLILVISTGCSSVGRTKDNPRVIEQKGTQGISMNFLAGAPINKVYDTNEAALKFALEIRNQGFDDVLEGDMRLKLSGYDTNILSIGPKSYGGSASCADSTHPFSGLGTEGLQKKSEYYPEGGVYTAEWDVCSINLPDGINKLTVPVIANLCYAYSTTATAMVCIDSDPYGATTVASDKSCTVRDVSLSGGQGGPVAVTRIEETIMPESNQVQFKVFIQNSNNGVLYESHAASTGATAINNLDKCINQNLDVVDLNKVKVEAKLGNSGPSDLGGCKPSVVNLYNGRGFTYCKFQIPSTGVFETPLTLYLDYGYKDSTSVNVQLLRTPG